MRQKTVSVLHMDIHIDTWKVEGVEIMEYLYFFIHDIFACVLYQSHNP